MPLDRACRLQEDGANDLDQLRKVELFRRLRPSDLKQVAQCLREQRCKRNGILYLEDDAGGHVFIVKSGRVKVSRVLPNGREMILAFHGAGESFGEMDLIDGEHASAMVTAVVASVLWMVPRALFEKLMSRPSVNEVLRHALCDRLRDALAQIEVLNFYHADSRVRKALYHLCDSRGTPSQDGVKIDLRLTHKDLAEMSGITRETATRVLRQLQGDGLLQVHSRHFVVKRPQALIEGLATS